MSNDSFARPTGIAWQGDGTYGQVQFGDDSKLFVQFYWKSVLDPQLSRAENKPMYRNVEYIIIQQPGERLNQIDRPVKEEDKYRFAQRWQQFQLNKTQVPEGTPIELLFPNTPAYADTLKGMGIYTIQQAGALSGTAIDAIGMGGQELVNKAQLYLKEAGDSKVYNQLKEELKNKDQEIKILREAQEKQRILIEDLYSKLGGNIALPVNTMQNVGYIPNVDAQLERINATHVTQEIKKAPAMFSGGKKAKEPKPNNDLDL